MCKPKHAYSLKAIKPTLEKNEQYEKNHKLEKQKAIEVKDNPLK